jgi:hypothetical protein
MATIEALQSADSNLSRSFAACVAIVVASLGWAIFVGAPRVDEPPRVDLAPLILFVLQVAFYIWYAISAGAAAKVLGSVGWHFVIWILAAPFLSLIPIPIVSGIISLSPLSIKFLLGGQLQTAIRQGTFAQLHEVPTVEQLRDAPITAAVIMNAPRKRHELNAPGDFYVENEMCIVCRAPERAAPELMGFVDGERSHCYFKRQPATPEETRLAIKAVDVACCGALRYGGSDRAIIAALGADACDGRVRV